MVRGGVRGLTDEEPAEILAEETGLPKEQFEYDGEYPDLPEGVFRGIEDLENGDTASLEDLKDATK